jgi:hypothetical protein
MTAASYTSRSFAPPALPTRALRHVVVALGIVLPVPICAASGLSLPLPTTVERIAAALVPWVDAVAMSANEALRPGAAGSIVPEATERMGDGTVSLVAEVTVPSRRGTTLVRIAIPRPVASVRPLRGETAAVTSTSSSKVASTPAARAATTAPPVAGAVDPGPLPAAPGEPTATPTPGTDAPAPTPTEPTKPSDPDPAPPPTQNDPDPVAPVKEAVNDVTAPLAPVVETTTNTVEETVAPVTELLPGLGK